MKEWDNGDRHSAHGVRPKAAFLFNLDAIGVSAHADGVAVKQSVHEPSVAAVEQLLDIAFAEFRASGLDLLRDGLVVG